MNIRLKKLFCNELSFFCFFFITQSFLFHTPPPLTPLLQTLISHYVYFAYSHMFPFCYIYINNQLQVFELKKNWDFFVSEFLFFVSENKMTKKLLFSLIYSRENWKQKLYLYIWSWGEKVFSSAYWEKVCVSEDY